MASRWVKAHKAGQVEASRKKKKQLHPPSDSKRIFKKLIQSCDRKKERKHHSLEFLLFISRCNMIIGTKRREMNELISMDYYLFTFESIPEILQKGEGVRETGLRESVEIPRFVLHKDNRELMEALEAYLPQ